MEAEGSMPPPPPQAPSVQATVPVAAGTYEYVKPSKKIHSQEDLRKFSLSKTAKDFIDWLVQLNDSVKGMKISQSEPTNPVVIKALETLETLDKWVDEIPPIEQPMRFGNKAFRVWLDKVNENSVELMKAILPEHLSDASVEISGYFNDSFGNRVRIDYGTGHETNFAAWMYCLTKLQLVGPSDYPSLVLNLFNRYLLLMRHIQKLYWLEPAGSHGVWGLDDYQFLSFYWGSSQLIGHPTIRPGSVRQLDMIEEHANEYMYFACVKYVRQMKTGPFGEHSPILNDIANLPVWDRANTGLLKMYMGEVFNKYPVIQHFLFGSIIPVS